MFEILLHPFFFNQMSYLEGGGVYSYYRVDCGVEMAYSNGGLLYLRPIISCS